MPSVSMARLTLISDISDSPHCGRPLPGLECILSHNKLWLVGPGGDLVDKSQTVTLETSTIVTRGKHTLRLPGKS